MRPGSQAHRAVATRENPVAHQNATWKPETRAGVAVPVIDCSRMTARTAVPNDPPICCAVRVSTLECAIWERSSPTYEAVMTGIVHDSVGLTPDDVRLTIRGVGRRSYDDVFQRAHDRGEIDLERIPQDVLDLPLQLMRHDILMTLRPVPPERIRSIVDDIFWPLAVQRHAVGDLTP